MGNRTRQQNRSLIIGILPILTLLYLAQLVPHSHSRPGHGEPLPEPVSHAGHSHTHSHSHDDPEDKKDDSPAESHHHHALSDHMDLHTVRIVVQNWAPSQSLALVVTPIVNGAVEQSNQRAAISDFDVPPDDAPSSLRASRAPPLTA